MMGGMWRCLFCERPCTGASVRVSLCGCGMPATGDADCWCGQAGAVYIMPA